MTNPYFQKFKKITPALVEVLEAKAVKAENLKFGGPGIKSNKRVTVPTDARSEFLANRAMGDWAEGILAKAINECGGGIKAVHYGDSSRISAGEDGFKEFYVERLNDVRVLGKRPDLLIFPNNFQCENDISGVRTSDLVKVVKDSIGSIEVRSSKFEALKNMEVRRGERKDGKLVLRDTLSFTVKVEDLKIVYRWIENHGVSQAYFQVFYDSVFAINFFKIFEIIASGKGFTIETPEKSQLKSTIMIPITSGEQIGIFTTPPTMVAEERVTRLYRHDAFVKPSGGEIKINLDAFKRALL